MTTDYYKTLEVDRAASLDVIEAAYRRLALRYHPDRNPAADAVRNMQALNEAYAVLRDSVKRQQYDRTLESASAAQQSAQQPRDYTTGYHADSAYSRRQRPTIPISCQSCGGTDATLRLVAFPYVFSIILFTFQRAWSGLYCKKCREKEMFKAKLVSTFFGWWGLPWGPIYALGALFRSSEGAVPKDENAAYLRQLCLFFLDQGNTLQAKRALSASLRYEYLPEVDIFYRGVFGESPDSVDPVEKKGSYGWMQILVVIGLFLLAIGMCSPVMNQPIPPRTPTPIVNPALNQLAIVPPARTPIPTRTPTPARRITPAPAAWATIPPTASPEPSPTPLPPTGRVSTGVFNVRSAPGGQLSGMSLRIGQEVAILGQYAKCTWLQIEAEDGRTGWIAMDDRKIKLSRDCDSIPFAVYRPPSFMVYAPSTLSGNGALKILNNDSRDAVVYLTDLQNNPVAVAFVRAYEEYIITGIRNGDYNVFVLHGEDWNGEHFLDKQSRKRFEDVFDFPALWSITLSPSVGGNATTETVAEDDFPEMPLQ